MKLEKVFKGVNCSNMIKDKFKDLYEKGILK